MSKIDKAVSRLEALRVELFKAIDNSIDMDGHHKSYEGRFSFVWPHRFNDEYCIKLDCYVIGPSRHHYWSGKSFEECMDKAERDIKEWISWEYEDD